jgi:hypothetical protein
MSVNRRTFMRILGSSAVIVAAGGGSFALTRTPASALAPWSAAGQGYSDPRVRALSYAILAPNPHNRQPWMVDLRGEEEAVLYCDPEKRLPETDPYNRQITIGLGCFLELLSQAAAEEGFALEITPFPEGEPQPYLDDRPVARIKFTRDASLTPDPLFAHVLERRSYKEPFDTAQKVSSTTLEKLSAAAASDVHLGVTNDATRIEMFRDLSFRAHTIEMITPRTMQESIDLMRIGKKAINENPDGIDLGGPMLEGMNKLGLLTHESLADPSSTAFKQGLDIYEAMLMSAMGYAWVITDGNGRLDQLAAGRAWIRTNLQATGLGLAIHPLSQALQEYPEMADLYREIHQTLGANGNQTVQMFGRLGYGPPVPPSPRWTVETKLI